MSASNWNQCPQCKTRLKKAKETAMREAAEAYGKVSAADYRRMLDEAAAMNPDGIEESLREDYEIGITDGGEFYVIYNAECQIGDCGFTHEFKHEKKLTLKE